MIGAWRVVCASDFSVTAPAPFTVEIEVEAGPAPGAGWRARLLASPMVENAEARVAVSMLAGLLELPVLEILAPDEMSREEEIADHVTRAKAAYSGWLEQRLGALIEETKGLEMTVRHGADDESQGDGQ